MQTVFPVFVCVFEHLETYREPGVNSGAGELKGFRLRNSWRTSTTACEEYIKRQFDEQAVICRSTDER